MDTANTGVLDASANNLYANRTGFQVECNGTAKGKVDHNFWGVGVTVDQSVSHCSVDNTLRLGAPILTQYSQSWGAGSGSDRSGDHSIYI